MNRKILLYVLAFFCGNCVMVGQSTQLTSYAWNDIEYQEWKEAFEPTDQQSRRFHIRVEAALNHSKDWMDYSHTAPEEESTECAREILFGYNLVRELLFQTLATDSSDIDFQWLQEVEVAIVKNKARRWFKFESPSKAQRDLIHSESSKILGPDHDVIPFSLSTVEEGEARYIEGRPVIAIGKLVDRDYRLAAIYHELGHIVHKDDQFINSEDFNDEKKLDEFLARPEVQQDLKRIDAYIALGRAKLSNNSYAGKNINALLAKNLTLWIQPHKRVKYKKMLVFRATEQRADLFMLDKLFEQGHITSLVRELETYSDSNFVTAIRS